MTCALAVVIALLAGDAQPPELPGAEPYLRAREAADCATALPAYAACIAADGPLRPWAEARTLYCRAREEGLEAVEKAYNQLLEAPLEDAPWLPMARAQYATLLRGESRFEDAMRHCRVLASLEPASWRLERYHWRAAQNALETEALAHHAHAFYRARVLTERFAGPRLIAARGLLDTPDIADRFLAVFAMLRTGLSREPGQALLDAAREIAALDKTPPAHVVDVWTMPEDVRPKRDKAQGKAHDYKAGQARFEAHPLRAVFTRLWLAWSVRALSLDDKIEDARRVGQFLLDAHPGAQETGEALWRLGKALEDEDEAVEALGVYLDMAASCPEYRRADESYFAAARIAAGAGDVARALECYRRIRADYASSSLCPAACFLSGALREAAGERTGAMQDYAAAVGYGVGEYYAHRAFESLHRLCGIADSKAARLPLGGADALVRPFPAVAAPVTPLPASLRADVRIARLFFFGEHGLGEGEFEALNLGAMLEKTPAPGPVYQALSEAGFAYTAMEFMDAEAWGEAGGLPSQARLRVLFPRAFWPLVQRAAEATGMDPFLILAVARQESWFRGSLSSSAGARGLMQVMPSTAQWLAKKKSHIPAHYADNLHSPYPSLLMGATYLHDMLASFDGNLVYALGAYNAGPGNMRKWLKRQGDMELGAFVEAIPFWETRHYVKAVLGNYAAYYSLYAPTA